MTETPNQALCSLAVQDKDPEALTFGLTAASLHEAKRVAARAGHREIRLLEVRPLEGAEIHEVGRRLAEENLLVGKDWLPLVDLFQPTFGLVGLHEVRFPPVESELVEEPPHTITRRSKSLDEL